MFIVKYKPGPTELLSANYWSTEVLAVVDAGPHLENVTMQGNSALHDTVESYDKTFLGIIILSTKGLLVLSTSCQKVVQHILSGLSILLHYIPHDLHWYVHLAVLVLVYYVTDCAFHILYI